MYFEGQTITLGKAGLSRSHSSPSQREMSGCQLVDTKVPGAMLPTFRVGLPTSTTQSTNSFTGMLILGDLRQRPVHIIWVLLKLPSNRDLWSVSGLMMPSLKTNEMPLRKFLDFKTPTNPDYGGSSGNPPLWRVTWKDCHEFKTILGDLANSQLAWASEWNPTSKQTSELGWWTPLIPAKWLFKNFS